jgi:inner membrane protein
MARREAHAVAGAISGVGSYVCVKDKLGEKCTLLEVLLAGLLGAAVGTIPDELEPASNPNHRGPFHSVGLLVAGATFTKRILDSPDVPSWAKVCSAVSCGAYASHLVLDGVSPKSLPLLGLNTRLLEG